MAVGRRHFNQVMMRWRRNANGTAQERGFAIYAKLQEYDEEDTEEAVKELFEDIARGEVKSLSHYTRSIGKQETPKRVRDYYKAEDALRELLGRRPTKKEAVEYMTAQFGFAPTKSIEARIASLDRAFISMGMEPLRLGAQIQDAEGETSTVEIGELDPAQLQSQFIDVPSAVLDEKGLEIEETIAPTLTQEQAARLVKKTMMDTLNAGNINVGIPLIIFWLRDYAKPRKSWKVIHEYLSGGGVTSGRPLRISMREVKSSYEDGRNLAIKIVQKGSL